MNIKITSEAVEAFKEDYEDDLSTTGFRLYLADKS